MRFWVISMCIKPPTKLESWRGMPTRMVRIIRVAGVFAPLAERTLLHAPRSVEQGPLRGVQHPRFNDPPPRGVRKGPKALPSKDFKKSFFPSAQHFYGI